MRATWSLLLGSVLLWGAGCQRQASAEEVEQLIMDQVRANEDFATILKSVKDQATMDAAWSRLVELNKRTTALQARAQSFGKPSPELLAMFPGPLGRLEAALADQREELTRIESLPGGPAFVQRLQTLREEAATGEPTDSTGQDQASHPTGGVP
jgi:hypothetical protein